MTINYDPRNVILMFGGALIDGYAPDTFIEIEFNSPRYATAVGATGKGIRSKRNDKSAVIRISLLPGSPSNLAFQAAMAADDANNSGAKPLKINDLGTGRGWVSAGAWVRQEPGASMQAEAQPQVWELETDELAPSILAAP
jgi:hypothetical protein